MSYDDEFAGQGGSYLLNPKTGKRTLIERTAPPTEELTDAISSPQDVHPSEDGDDRGD